MRKKEYIVCGELGKRLISSKEEHSTIGTADTLIFDWTTGQDPYTIISKRGLSHTIHRLRFPSEDLADPNIIEQCMRMLMLRRRSWSDWDMILLAGSFWSRLKHGPPIISVEFWSRPVQLVFLSFIALSLKLNLECSGWKSSQSKSFHMVSSSSSWIWKSQS